MESPKKLKTSPCMLNACSVYESLFTDYSNHGPLTENLSQELLYLKRRIHSEGLTLIACDMPLLGKAVETALITGECLAVPKCWKLAKDSRLPRFLNTIFKRVFDASGCLNPSYEGRHADVFFLRQTLLLFSKMESPAGFNSPLAKTDSDALSEWVSRATKKWEPPYEDGRFREVIACTRRLLAVLFSDDSQPTIQALRRFSNKPWGRHGPGAVAGREKGEDKWDFQTWPGLPSSLFEWAPGKPATMNRTTSGLTHQPVARVCLVPKDFRGPRVICIEPKENQFAQQGLMALLFDHLMSHPFSRRSIDFVDTRESERLCFETNVSTIDMKDASDYVSLDLARLVLPRWIFRLVTRYRTRYVDCNGHRIETTSLATMGNATCFPLETLIFWAISMSALHVVSQSWPKATREKLLVACRAFGDDIIVPSWGCDVVVDALSACGLHINKEKTCHLTLVKESCGEWVFDGKSMRIVRLRTPACVVSDLRSWLQVRDYARSFREVSYFATAEALSEISEQKWKSIDFKRRYNPDLQRLEIRIPVFFTEGRESELADYVALYAWQVGNDVTPYSLGARKRVKWEWISLSDFERI